MDNINIYSAACKGSMEAFKLADIVKAFGLRLYPECKVRIGGIQHSYL